MKNGKLKVLVAREGDDGEGRHPSSNPGLHSRQDKWESQISKGDKNSHQ